MLFMLDISVIDVYSWELIYWEVVFFGCLGRGSFGGTIGELLQGRSSCRHGVY